MASGDPQYAHYNGPLHVKIETTAPPALAYKRVAGVLEVLGELLKPVDFIFLLTFVKYIFCFRLKKHTLKVSLPLLSHSKRKTVIAKKAIKNLSKKAKSKLMVIMVQICLIQSHK